MSVADWEYVKVQNHLSGFWHIAPWGEVMDNVYAFDKPLCGRRRSISIHRGYSEFDPDEGDLSLRICRRCRQRWIARQVLNWHRVLRDEL